MSDGTRQSVALHAGMLMGGRVGPVGAWHYRGRERELDDLVVDLIEHNHVIGVSTGFQRVPLQLPDDVVALDCSAVLTGDSSSFFLPGV